MADININEQEEKKSLNFIEQKVKTDLAEEWRKTTDSFSTRAQRLLAYRSCQGYCYGLWGSPKIRWCLQPENGRH